MKGAKLKNRNARTKNVSRDNSFYELDVPGKLDVTGN